jgi:hypothetical protein
MLAADGATVVKFNIALAPEPFTVTGFGLPTEQAGAGLTTGETLHESLTVPA